MDFARIKAALENEDPRSVSYFVLTLDPSRYRGVVSRWELWAELGRMCSIFLKRLKRQAERDGGDPIGSRWVCVVEQHRNGWPHLNLVCVSRWLADRVRSVRSVHREIGVPENEVALVGGDVARHAIASGFGQRSTVEPARSLGAVAGYLVKLAGLCESKAEHWGDPEQAVSAKAVAEVAKLTQAPTRAPKGFRRLRSGIRFLPPRTKGSGQWTGALASWDGRLLRRGSVIAGRSTVAIDLDGGRVYRADRLPLQLGHDAPVKRYALKPPCTLGGTPVGPAPAAEQARAVAIARALLGATGSPAQQLATLRQALPGPAPPRSPPAKP
jgi:hypothetical protein